MLSDDISRCVKAQAAAVYKRAGEHSDQLISNAKREIERFAAQRGLDLSNLCFVVVGSIGRSEALEASDLDLIPIADSQSALAVYEPHDQDLRQALRSALGIKVSNGKDLTKPIPIEDLTESDSIGGPNDNSGKLTKRILILTESRQICGGYPLNTIRRGVLDAYGSQERTSGRHALSLCNDLARYFRTLCIEYKTKVDVEDKDWCTRNLKLRHSRKVWYFSNLISIVHLAQEHPRGKQSYSTELLQIFDKPPVVRLGDALFKEQPIELGRVLERYSVFLEFMSVANNRAALAAVAHDRRYELIQTNPFPSMKFNSDLLHNHFKQILKCLPPTTYQRVIDWFLL